MSSRDTIDGKTIGETLFSIVMTRVKAIGTGLGPNPSYAHDCDAVIQSTLLSNSFEGNSQARIAACAEQFELLADNARTYGCAEDYRALAEACFEFYQAVQHHENMEAPLPF